MKRLITVLVALFVTVVSLGTPGPVHGKDKPEVVLSIPTLTDLAQRIGGDRFNYVTMAEPDQDPHYVQPTPSLMQRINDADLFMQIGMQLEVWADQVTEGSGNPTIYRGNPGRVILSGPIPKLQVPRVASRAEGHIHPQGNPHFWLDPVRTKMLIKEIYQGLLKVAPDGSRSALKSNYQDLRAKINRRLYGEKLLRLVGENRLDNLSLDGELWGFLTERSFGDTKLIEHGGPWLQVARSLHGENIIEYHQEWIYFATTYGMDIVGTVEEKPGIPPGPQHVKRTVNLIQQHDVKVILIDSFYDPSTSKAIARKTRAEVVIVPSQVGGTPETDGYFKFMDYLLKTVSKAVEKTKT